MVSDLPVGTMLGKYEVLRKLATGGMAEIYLARLRGHAGFEKLVVVKRILPSAAEDPRLIQMFLDEAKLVATLQHPNIADVHEVGEDRGAPYFVMEHIHGEDVRTIRHAASERKQGVPLRLSLAIIHAIASALDYAHARKGADGKNLNLVHRDISASNMLVSYQGAIKLIDFGVARVTTRTQTTQAGTVKGKVPYMSPEQCQGHAMDRRSDLFSLGVVMYELTVGQRPFQAANDFDLMRQIVHTDARRPSTINDGYPARLEKIVLKLLARKPEARYRTGEELLQELEPFMDHHQLWVPPKKISRYMQSLFRDRIAAWEVASRGDVKTFVEHVALTTPERKPGDTPPTPLPVVMRLSQEIQSVALDSEQSIAHVMRPGADPLDALDDGGAGGDSIALKPGGDTITIRTGESELYGVPAAASTAPVTEAVPADAADTHEPSGDTITQPPGATGPTGDTITQPPGAPDVLSGDTITVKPAPASAGVDPTAAAIAANRPRTGGAYQVRPERAATATERTAAATRTPPAGVRAATDLGVTKPRTPVSGVRVRLETSNEAEPPAAAPSERSSGVVSMWRPASVVSRQPTSTGEGDGDGGSAAFGDSARERLRSDADAVADALGAPSMVAAIDALGAFEESAGEPAPPAVPIVAPAPSSLPAEETWDQPGTTPHARAPMAFVQASSSAPLTAPMLGTPMPMPRPLVTPPLSSSVGPPLVAQPAAPPRNRTLAIVVGAIVLAIAIAAAIVLAP